MHCFAMLLRTRSKHILLMARSAAKLRVSNHEESHQFPLVGKSGERAAVETVGVLEGAAAPR